MRHKLVLFGLLGLLAASWTVVAIELHYGFLGMMELANALMFTAMVIAWPFLLGWRAKDGHVVQLPTCRECGRHEMAGFSRLMLDFCLRCGARAAIRPAMRSYRAVAA